MGLRKVMTALLLVVAMVVRVAGDDDPAVAAGTGAATGDGGSGQVVVGRVAVADAIRRQCVTVTYATATIGAGCVQTNGSSVNAYAEHYVGGSAIVWLVECDDVTLDDCRTLDTADDIDDGYVRNRVWTDPFPNRSYYYAIVEIRWNGHGHRTMSTDRVG